MDSQRFFVRCTNTDKPRPVPAFIIGKPGHAAWRPYILLRCSMSSMTPQPVTPGIYLRQS